MIQSTYEIGSLVAAFQQTSITTPSDLMDNLVKDLIGQGDMDRVFDAPENMVDRNTLIETCKGLAHYPSECVKKIGPNKIWRVYDRIVGPCLFFARDPGWIHCVYSHPQDRTVVIFERYISNYFNCINGSPQVFSKEEFRSIFKKILKSESRHPCFKLDPTSELAEPMKYYLENVPIIVNISFAALQKIAEWQANKKIDAQVVIKISIGIKQQLNIREDVLEVTNRLFESLQGVKQSFSDPISILIPAGDSPYKAIMLHHHSVATKYIPQPREFQATLSFRQGRYVDRKIEFFKLIESYEDQGFKFNLDFSDVRSDGSEGWNLSFAR